MSERIHDDEPDTSEAVVRALLRTELPQWAPSPVEYLATSGTDNAMWRIHIDDGPDVVAPAWAVLTAAERPAFREAVGPSDAAWLRGRTFELEHAVGGVLYYTPKKHPLGDVTRRP